MKHESNATFFKAFVLIVLTGHLTIRSSAMSVKAIPIRRSPNSARPSRPTPIISRSISSISTISTIPAKSAAMAGPGAPRPVNPISGPRRCRSITPAAASPTIGKAITATSTSPAPPWPIARRKIRSTRTIPICWRARATSPHPMVPKVSTRKAISGMQLFAPA